MPKKIHISYSPVAICASSVAFLIVVYIGMIAIVMSYAASTVEFSQSVRDSEAAVARLESKYLAMVSKITTTDYGLAGYSKPLAKSFVPTQSVTARR